MKDLERRLVGKKPTNTPPVFNCPSESLLAEDQSILLLFRGTSGHKVSFVAFSTDTVIPFLFNRFDNFRVDCCFLLRDLDIIILAIFGRDFFRQRPGVFSRDTPFIWLFHHLRTVRMFAPNLFRNTNLCHASSKHPYCHIFRPNPVFLDHNYSRKYSEGVDAWKYSYSK